MSIIIVSGALANKPHNGGEAWVRLNWVLGLRQLGFQVYFIEQIEPGTCIDGAGNKALLAESVNLAYFRQVCAQFGIDDQSALLAADGTACWGLSYQEVIEVAEAADLLVNISGHLTLSAVVGRISRKAYIDIDPGFTQFWYAEGLNCANLAGHDFYYTIGENIGTAACPIPTGDLPWRPIRQPVVLAEWPVCGMPAPFQLRSQLTPQMAPRFTTVASWRGAYGPVQNGAVTYGVKVHEFRKVITLPCLAPAEFEIALDIHPDDHQDLARLAQNAWHIVDPRQMAGDPVAFRDYVQRSAAEFSVAQGIYADTNSGWFSDRTVRYLASGRPALVQETGFRRYLPVGEGLLSFRTLDEAVAGVECITRDYTRHARAARAVAETYFDAQRVLMPLVEEVGLAP